MIKKDIVLRHGTTNTPKLTCFRRVDAADGDAAAEDYPYYVFAKGRSMYSVHKSELSNKEREAVEEYERIHPQ